MRLGKRTTILLASLSLWSAASAQDVATRLDMADLNTALLRCAGAYDVFAAISIQTGDQGNSQFYHDFANGAEVASAAISTLMGAPKEQATVQAINRRQSEGIYISGLVRNKDFDTVQAILVECAAVYSPIQGAIIRALRAYADSGSNDPDLWVEMMTQALSSLR